VLEFENVEGSVEEGVRDEEIGQESEGLGTFGDEFVDGSEGKRRVWERE
jgi:hypothetical protein